VDEVLLHGHAGITQASPLDIREVHLALSCHYSADVAIDAVLLFPSI
jgi:hypothetical protein